MQNLLILKLLLILLYVTAAFQKADAVETLSQGSQLRSTGFEAKDLAVVINDDDPLSRAIGEYYQSKRGIPAENMIHLRFTPGQPIMAVDEFNRLKGTVDLNTPKHVQAYALTWVKPYRVDCLSITTAFAFGYDAAFCANGCSLTRESPYFNSDSWVPYRHYQIRPSMSLAANTLEDAKRLIDRGISSDNTYPRGTGYLVNTSDKNRSVRSFVFEPLVRQIGHSFDLRMINQDYIEDRLHVFFYFTGLVQVPKIETNVYTPGAIADHLTSAGGVLDGSDQMSSLRWLEVGATGSYGAVVEPCNFPQKFPNPAIVVSRYLNGESLIEAYWKSVAMPGQGIFIGEPLAKPFGSYRVIPNADTDMIR